MKKIFVSVLACVLSLFSYANCFALDDESEWACFDLELLYVRGSGGDYEDSPEFLAVIAAAQKMTDKYGVSVYSHDLAYPAIGLDSLNRIIGAYVSAGKAYSFGRSVRTGVTNLRKHYSEMRANCPDMKFGFIGYSQGAMVVSHAASGFDADSTLFLMLIGDPEAYLPEGGGLFPAACYSGAKSS